MSNGFDDRQKYAQLVTIVGETASGKSQAAMELAQRFDGEIIAADSTTVYRGFDIGTAKPSPADQRAARHHLLDVADAAEGFTAAQFKRLAKEAIADIASRGKLSIMVGGSGLYIDSMLFDYQFHKPADATLRQELMGLSRDELLARAEAEGLSLENIDIQNPRRLMRLIETGGKPASKQPLRPNTIVVGIQIPRDELVQRVHERVDAMFANGLEAEVSRLAEQYGWDVEPMKGIGYREFRPYFSGGQNLDEVKADITADTLKLAKKQRTWFRRNKSIHWFNNREEIVGYTTTLLEKSNTQ